jgi:hypothetical protein
VHITSFEYVCVVYLVFVGRLSVQLTRSRLYQWTSNVTSVSQACATGTSMVSWGTDAIEQGDSDVMRGRAAHNTAVIVVHAIDCYEVAVCEMIRLSTTRDYLPNHRAFFSPTGQPAWNHPHSPDKPCLA